MPPYFDSNATTALAPEVVEALLPFLREGFGNPSSLHPAGTHAGAAVARARSSVGRLLGARSPSEVMFTSGGTESIHAAIWSAVRASPGRRRLVTSAVEHAAVLAPLERLEARDGYEVVRAGVDADGHLDTRAVLDAIDERCALVTLQWVNNETGVVTPTEDLAAIGRECRQNGASFHVDAMQAAGKIPMRVRELEADFVSISAHKFHGPKGSGALWIRPEAAFEPFYVGGPQEHDRRAGTENVPAIVGAGRAAELALAHVEDANARRELALLRDRLERALLERIPAASVNGAGAPRVPSTSSLVFDGVSGEALVMLLGERGLEASSGSACSSGKHGASRVLLAMGVQNERALGALRLSLSRYTRADEVEQALEIVPEAVSILRTIAPPHSA